MRLSDKHIIIQFYLSVALFLPVLSLLVGGDNMKYYINKRNYRDFSKFEENRLPHRAYFIPFLSSENMSSTTYLNERFKSDAVLLLSGQWDFAYYKSAS